MAKEPGLSKYIADASEQDCLAASNTSAMVKSAFRAWISEDRFRQHDADSVIAFLDKVSEQLLHRRLSYVSLWEITNPNIFINIYKDAINNKLFRVTDRKTHSAFIQIGKLYLKFLKSKPTLHKVAIIDPKVVEKHNNGLTIKEAVIQVLRTTQRGLTVEEIYRQIIENNLYAFGAQHPKNVVRNVIECACENSNYTNRDSVSRFRSERDYAGEKVYFLLTINTTLTTDEKTVSNDADSISATNTTGETVDIWNGVVEQSFQTWLQEEHYITKRAENYSRTISRIIRDYHTLLLKAISTSSSSLDAVRKYTALLKSDKNFLAINSMKHNRYTAALAVFERYYAFVHMPNSADSKLLDSYTEQEELSNRGSVTPLNNIIDLDEGKSGIREILVTHFQTLYGYSNINILWNAARSSLTMFLNDNAINTPDTLWDFLCRAFMGEFVFSSPHIWQRKPDYPQSVIGIVVNLARQYDGVVSREQIDDYFSRIRINTPFNTAILRQGLLLFCASKKFILTEIIDLSQERCDAVKKALGRLFSAESVTYIVLRDISEEWFSRLPEIKGGIPWTALLLQEVLRIRPDIGYRVISSGLDGQSLDTLGAAIVPSKSEIITFADVVHRYCYERYTLPIRILAEELRLKLREAGMLEGNELIYNIHKALKDYRFGFTDENKSVKILER